MGNKRRGSQAFSFEQSQETLQQNESIVNLYKNKIFVAPDPKEFETIIEEGQESKGHRARRNQVATDGSLVIGVNKSKRCIEEYKFWKQEDKERNRKRKLMVSKLWKGRKKAKLTLLKPDQEQKLIDLIADREPSSDEEEESSPSKKRKITQEPQDPVASNCVWKAVGELEHQSSKHPSTSSNDLDYAATCVWANENDDQMNSIQDPSENKDSDSHRDSLAPSNNSTTRRSSSGLNQSRRRKSSLSLSMSHQTESSRRRSSVDKEMQHNTMFELQGLIPDSELAELLATDDLLFCTDNTSQKPAQVLGSVENTISSDNKVHNSRKSIRRSARLMCQPGFAGSVYSGHSNLGGDHEDLGGEGKENSDHRKKKSKTRIPSTKEPHVDEQVGLPHDVNKKRRSYSLEDSKGRPSGRYSLDGSRKNSLLTITGDMEINISMPEAVRRSFSTSDIPSFQRTTPKTQVSDNDPHIEDNSSPVKFGLPKPFFVCSDSEEEEVIVSGNIKKNFLKKPVKARKKAIL